ncbi:MAG: hypothetical protein RL297_1972, partial [Pseudomonadota bacterium]
DLCLGHLATLNVVVGKYTNNSRNTYQQIYQQQSTYSQERQWTPENKKAPQTLRFRGFFVYFTP